MPVRYKQTPGKETDQAILEKHPFVKVWQEVTPHLLKYNSNYDSLNCDV